MNELNAMKTFVQVAELKNFSAAALALSMPKSSVSQLVKQLEDTLGARLLNRTTRRVTLTNEGTVFYQRCKDMLADIDELQTLFHKNDEALSGRLRVDMPQPISRRLVLPNLEHFLSAHPQLEIELSSSDRRVNLIEEGFDCVVRVGNLEDSSLIAKRIGHCPMINCVSPSYIKQHGNITKLADLAEHYIVRYSQTLGQLDPGFEYQDTQGDWQILAMKSQLTVNNTDAYRAACLAGLGLIQVPRHGVIDELSRGELVQVLPDYNLPPMPINIVYPNRRHLPRRTRVFIDWLSEQLQPVIEQK